MPTDVARLRAASSPARLPAARSPQRSPPPMAQPRAVPRRARGCRPFPPSPPPPPVPPPPPPPPPPTPSLPRRTARPARWRSARSASVYDACRVAARPGVAHAVDGDLLHPLAPARRRVAAPAGAPAHVASASAVAGTARAEHRVGVAPLPRHLVAVDRRDDRVRRAVHHEHAHRPRHARHRRSPPALACCAGSGPPSSCAVDAPARLVAAAYSRPADDDDRREAIGIGGAENHAHRRARRQPRRVGARAVDGVLARDMIDERHQRRRLAGAALLVRRIEPLPALERLRRRRLVGVEREEAVRLGDGVHVACPLAN